jgi:hypothetical protein
MIVIVDIDNTLSLSDNRFNLAKKPNGKTDWDIVHDPDNIILDKPFYPMIDLVKKYKSDGFEIILLTGRPESVRNATEFWLQKYDIEYEQLYMREKKEHFLKAPIFKRKVYEERIKSNIFCAYDDDEEIIQMWNSLGIPAFKVYTIQ